MGGHEDALKNGVVLAELGGYGDGWYCARHGAGAALAVLGTYIVDPGDSVPYPPAFVFKPGRHNYAGYLGDHVTAARGGGAAVGVSVICVDRQDDIDFLQAAEEAGADYLSLCFHSSMEMFTSRSLSSAMLRRDRWPQLREHVRAVLGAIRGPFIAKIGSAHEGAFGAAEQMAGEGVKIFHACVPGAPTPSGQEVIRYLRHCCEFLIVGGDMRTEDDARRVLNAGADAVAIDTAAMEDTGLCGRLQAAVRLVR